MRLVIFKIAVKNDAIKRFTSQTLNACSSIKVSHMESTESWLG
jgi:hypothetical protein